jgi:hypothetical protein
MDKQWSTKHYPENLRLSNKNPTKNWESNTENNLLFNKNPTKNWE